MKSLLTKAGADGKNILFMFSDAQVGSERSYIYEDLNNMLNTGDIPNLFT